jgi:hypothetical protein
MCFERTAWYRFSKLVRSTLLIDPVPIFQVECLNQVLR